MVGLLASARLRQSRSPGRREAKQYRLRELLAAETAAGRASLTVRGLLDRLTGR